MRRRAAKIDANQPDIVKALRGVGAKVLSLAPLGNGAPDLLCGFRGVLWAFEVKDGSLCPSARKLTPAEAAFHAEWDGYVRVVLGPEDALRVIGAVK